MPRPTCARRIAACGHRFTARVEPLERRHLPASGLPAYLAAVGFGVTGKNSAIHSNAVATDAGGDVVVTGSFRGTVAFGSVSFTSASTQDTFVAKYAPTGALLWARTFAGQATTAASTTTYAVGQGSAVAVDSAGNIIIAGSFAGTVNFGTAGTPKLVSSPSNTEAFVAWLDGSGNLTWVRNGVAAGGDDQANTVALDGRGG